MGTTQLVLNVIDGAMANVMIDGGYPTATQVGGGKIVYKWPNGSEIEVDVDFKVIVRN